MLLLPSQRLVIESRQALAVVRGNLNSQVAAKRWLRLSKDYLPFEGTVDESQFSIQRTIFYRNPFRPFIIGSLEPWAEGTRITLHFTLKPVVFLWQIAGFAFLALMLVCVLVIAPSQKQPMGMFPFMLLAMLAFDYGMVMVSFLLEARIAKRQLNAIFQNPATAPRPSLPVPPATHCPPGNKIGEKATMPPEMTLIANLLREHRR